MPRDLSATPFWIGLATILVSALVAWFVILLWEREASTMYDDDTVTAIKQRFTRDTDAIQSAASLLALAVALSTTSEGGERSFGILVVVGAAVIIMLIFVVLQIVPTDAYVQDWSRGPFTPFVVLIAAANIFGLLALA